MKKIPSGGFLALDWGGSKVGYATCDDQGLLVTPRGIFQRKSRKTPWQLTPADVEQLKKLAKLFEPGGIILGLPLNADGTESEGSRGARALAVELGQALKLEITLVPEILTSWAARGEKQEDAVAAATLISDYLGGRT